MKEIEKDWQIIMECAVKFQNEAAAKLFLDFASIMIYYRQTTVSTVTFPEKNKMIPTQFTFEPLIISLLGSFGIYFLGCYLTFFYLSFLFIA